MGKTLIIAEKPSLAKEIKEMLTASFGEHWQTQKDYSESENYYLSSFFGHILEQFEPADYDPKYKAWKAEDLPIMPFKIMFRYKSDCETRGKLLSSLAQKSDKLVNACDPDREGEGIFRIWYEYEEIKKPFMRLWAQSLALKDLTKSWEKLQDGHKYDSLSHAQRCRMEADWLTGMNGSRAYAIASKQKLSIGRVQTPTLALIVKRDAEVENYKESFYYSLTGNWNDLSVIYINDKETKFENKNQIDVVKNESTGTAFKLKSFAKENKVQNPSKPFSMPDLQKEANKKFGFSLDKTLEIAQGLYEKKVTSYPRTDSPNLPPADSDKYYQVIDKFASQQQKDLLIPKGSSVPCLKESDSAHTAIIPTGIAPQGLSEDEKKLYLLILNRFVTAFLKPRTYFQYSILISNGKHDFRSNVYKTIDKGFTAIEQEKDDESEDEVQEVAQDLTEAALSGKVSQINNLTVQTKKRAKPQYFTPATLLGAMMTVGKTVENKKNADILKDLEGLGTPATRDKVPKDLERREYIEKHGKFIRSTDKGRQLIGWVRDDLKSPELTAQWERKLRDMEAGNYDPDKFKLEIRDFIKSVVHLDQEALGRYVDSINEAKRKCSKCGKALNENDKGFFCTQECGFAIWKSLSGKKLSSKNIDELFSTGKSSIIDGFEKKDKSGTFSARLVIEAPEYKVKFSFDNSTDYHCPICEGIMKSFSSNLRCEKCGFSVWYTMSEKKISESNIKALLTKGKTGLIKGFISIKNGKPFDAFLVVNKQEKKVYFEFPKQDPK